MLVNKFLSNNVTDLRCLSSLSSHILTVGDILKERRIFSSEDVLKYSKVSHDSNPLHFDSEYAQNVGFEDRLVHGMLVAALFPRIIASHFPGAVYMSQSLHFRIPVYIGEEIVAEVQATTLKENKKEILVSYITKGVPHFVNLGLIYGLFTWIFGRMFQSKILNKVLQE